MKLQFDKLKRQKTYIETKIGGFPLPSPEFSLTLYPNVRLCNERRKSKIRILKAN